MSSGNNVLPLTFVCDWITLKNNEAILAVLFLWFLQCDQNISIILLLIEARLFLKWFQRCRLCLLFKMLYGKIIAAFFLCQTPELKRLHEAMSHEIIA